MGKLFGTNGVRGVANQDLTPELAFRLGRAIGSWLPVKATVAVGTDARTSGPMLEAAAISGLLSSGCRVVRLGIGPTPALQYYVKTHEDIQAGLVVTASHNPPEFNGLKLVFRDGTETSKEEEDAVEALYFQEAFRTVPWSELLPLASDASANEAYRHAVLQRVDAAAIRSRRFKVVCDTGGGPGGLVTPQLLRDLGCEVIPIFEALDGAFTGRKSEPTQENLGRLIEAVKAERADLGLAHDGDADRCIFIDEAGNYLSGDVSLTLLARSAVGRQRGGLVCTPVSSSSLLEEVVTQAGGRVRTTAVGSPIVAREMMRTAAVFGGEENGGLIFPDHQYCRDAAMTAAKMLELLAQEQSSLGALVATLPRYHQTKLKFAVPPDQKEALLARFRQWVAKEYPRARVDTTDGIKAYVDQGWVLVRPSGTEPIYRVFAESKDAAHSKALAERFLEAGKRLAARP